MPSAVEHTAAQTRAAVSKLSLCQVPKTNDWHACIEVDNPPRMGLGAAGRGYAHTQVSGGSGATPEIVAVGGTNTTQPAAVTPLTGITPDEGALALGETNADGSARTLLVHVADGGGTLETVTVSGTTLTADTALATGSVSAGIVGPDGCFYIGGQHSVYKLTPTSGNCGLTPTTLGPTLTLSPATLTSNPTQGGTQAFTATLKGAATVSGVPVYFLARGANTALQQVVTDSNGVASWTYTGRAVGTDKVYAATSVAGASTATQEQLTSNTVHVTWNTGTHATSLTLNLGPSSGTANTRTTVTANLTDAAVSPVVALASQSVSFTLGAASCAAVTDSNGNATCQLALPNAGSSTLSASFAGNSQEAASTASIAFNVARRRQRTGASAATGRPF